MYTYYVTDATGNVMATYDRAFEESESPSFDYKDKLTLSELHIFGSSRLGMLTPIASKSRMFEGAISETGTPVYDGAEDVFEYHFTGIDYDELSGMVKENTGRYFMTAGKKIYELSNHLGNVNVTITDQKIAIEGATGIVEYYSAEIISITDYYAFGSPMDERVQSAEEYRYGFQNQETDNELWNGAVAYKYRVEDPRLGRFFSVDPLTNKYPWNSSYSFSANRVIAFIELEGAEMETPAYFREGKGYTAAIDNTTTALSNTQIVEKKVELTRQSIISAPLRMFQEIEKSQGTISQYDQPPSMTVRAPNGQTLTSKQAVQQGKNTAETLGIDAAVSIAIGKDIETNEDLSKSGYLAFAAGAFIEFTPIGKILPEASEKAVIGYVKKGGARGLRLTTKQARESAKALGLEEVTWDNVPNNLKRTDGLIKTVVVFKDKTGKFFSPDVTGHKTDYGWKIFDGSIENRKTAIFDGKKFIEVGN